MHRQMGAGVLSPALLALLAVAPVAAQLIPPPPPLLPPDPQRSGAIFIQCPGDTNGDAVPDAPTLDTNSDGIADTIDPKVKCVHLTGGDGFLTMADGTRLYVFGFSDVTGVAPGDVMNVGALSANGPAPTIRLKEGQHFYLNLTNVGMVMRPDLSDPHSVHFHGFPNAAPVFDGVPETSIVINQGSTLTYFYKIVDPGTFMWHCHVEATEHIQMGMVGNLYVEPAQNELPEGTLLGTSTHHTGQKYAYNDGDGSTRYDVEYPIQIGSFDPEFHNASETIQPLPFAIMKDRYPLLNGRGYPDTVNTAILSSDTPLGPKASQRIHSLITATAGERVLLRISSLVTTRFYTLASTIPMRAVGHNARLLRGPSGNDLSYTTNSVTLGGGESIDVILETAGLAPGTYLLYTTNLNYLSNDHEDYGGMMTEIIIQ